MSMYTFLIIALGGSGIRAEAWPMNDGGHMPVIVQDCGLGRAPLLLISWDEMRVPAEEAMDYAAKCIAWVREEAPRRGILREAGLS